MKSSLFYVFQGNYKIFSSFLGNANQTSLLVISKLSPEMSSFCVLFVIFSHGNERVLHEAIIPACYSFFPSVAL